MEHLPIPSMYPIPYPHSPTGFRDRRLQPLGHRSRGQNLAEAVPTVNSPRAAVGLASTAQQGRTPTVDAAGVLRLGCPGCQSFMAIQKPLRHSYGIVGRFVGVDEIAKSMPGARLERARELPPLGF